MNYNPAFNRVASFWEIAHQVSNQSAEPASANQALDGVTAPVLAGARLVANVRVTRGAVDAEALAAELEQAAPGKVRRIKLPANPAELAAFVKKWEAANLAKRMGGAGMLILPLAACGGGGGGGGVFGGGDAGTSGFVIDGYVAGAAVSRVNGSGNTVYTEADGSFSGLTGHGPIKVDLSGATDIDRPGFVFPDGTVLTAPEGSTVVTPLTALMQTLIDGGKTLDEAQEMVATWAGVDPDTDLRSYDFVSAQDASAYVKAQQVLNIVSTAAAGDVMKAEDTLKALADLITDNQAANLGDSEVVRQALIDAGAGYTVANAIASQVRDHNKQLGDLLEELEEGNKTFDELQADAKSVNESQGKNNADGQGLVLLGDDNANELVGTERNDKLIGGRGGDTLTGGEGEDTFVFTLGAEGVRIAFNAEREPVAGDVYSVKLGENGENYFQVEVEEGQSLQQVLSALVNEINKDADLEDVTAYREGDAIVVIGFGTDEAEAEVRGAGEAGEISNVFTIDFSGEGTVKEGQLYIINITGREEPIVYTAGAGDELADVIEGLRALIDAEEGLSASADPDEGTITITASNRDYRVGSVSVKEPADITAEAVDSIEIVEAHDATVRIDVTNEQAATAGSFSITIGGKEIKLEGEALESVADGDGLAGAIADAIEAELGADNGVTVAWADGVLTITDSNSRFLSDASLKTAESVEIDGDIEIDNDSHAAPQVSVVTFGDVPPQIGYTYSLVVDGKTYSVTVGQGPVGATFGSVLKGLWAALEEDGYDVAYDADARALTITGKVEGTQAVPFEIAVPDVIANREPVADAVEVEAIGDVTTIAFADRPPMPGDIYTVTIGETTYSVFVDGEGDDGVLATFEAVLEGLKAAIEDADGVQSVAYDTATRTLTITGVEGPVDIDPDEGFVVTRMLLEDVDGALGDNPVTTTAGREAPEPEPQESVITFENIEVQDGYTYTVTIEGKTYSVTAGEDEIEDLADVLNALKAAIEADADGEDGHGLSVEVGDGEYYTLTITGREDGTPFTVGGVTVTDVTEVAEVDGALGASPVDTAAGKEVPMAQVSTITFTGDDIAADDTYTVTINGADYSVTVGEDGIGENLASVLEGLKAEIDQAGLGFRVEVTDDNKLVITGLNDETFTIESNGPEGDTGSVDTDLVPGQWQVSTITFGDVAPEVGYTYKVTINGEDYSVTVDEEETSLEEVLEGLKAEIDEAELGLRVKVVAIEGPEPDDGSYQLVITGPSTGAGFEIADVSVTEIVPIVGRLLQTLNNMPGFGGQPQSNIIFLNEGHEPEQGDSYKITIGDHVFEVTVGVNGVSATADSILGGLATQINNSQLGGDGYVASYDNGLLKIIGPDLLTSFSVVVKVERPVSVEGALDLDVSPVDTDFTTITQQVAVITFENIEVMEGYTYTVTINETAYDYTAVEGDDLGAVLNALKDAIDADAATHGLSVEVGEGEYTLTITGKPDGTEFEIENEGVTVTKVADVDGALGDDPVHNDYYAAGPAAQVSTVTFKEIPVEAGYTYTVTINGKPYSVTADGGDIADLDAVLNALKDAIEADADGEGGHGLSVEVTAEPGEGGGEGEYKLTITGGTEFEIENEGVTVTKVADVDGALGDDPVHNDYYPIAPAAQVSVVTFEEIPVGAGYTYTVTINGTAYDYTAVEGNLWSHVLDGLKAKIEADFEDHGLSVAPDAATLTLTITGKDDGTPFVVNSVAVTELANVDVALGDNPIATTDGVYADDTQKAEVETTTPASEGVAQVDTVTFSGNVEEGDYFRITIGDHVFAYRAEAEDTLESVRDALIALISGATGLGVTAAAFTEGDDVALTLTALIPNESFEATAEALNSAPQVSVVTFEDVPPEAGYVYFILIDGRLYSVTADGEEGLAAVLTELKEKILEDVDGEDGHGLSVALLPPEGENGSYQLVITGKPDGTAFEVQHAAVVTLETETIAGAVGEEPVDTVGGVDAVREQVEVTFADRELTEGDTYTIAVTVAGCLTTFTYLVMEEGITLADVLAALAADINQTEDLEAEVVDGVLVIAGPEDGSHLDVTAGVTSQEYKDVDIMSLGEERIVDLSVLDLSTGEKILIAIGDDEFEEVFGSGDSADALALRLQAQIEEAETGVTVTVLDGRISFSYGGEGDAPEISVSHVGLGDEVEDAIPDDNLTEVGLSDSIIDSMAHITDFVVGEDVIDIRDFVESNKIAVTSLERLEDVVWNGDHYSYNGHDFEAVATLADILDHVFEEVGAEQAAIVQFQKGELDEQTYLFVNDDDAQVTGQDLIINLTGIDGLHGVGDLNEHMDKYLLQANG